MAEPIQPTNPAPDPAPQAGQTPVVEPAETSLARVEPTPRVEPIETSVRPPKKRRRWLGWVIALIVILVLAVVAFFVAETFVRQYAETTVREQIVQVLPVEPGTPVEVTIGPGSILLQALGGSIDSIDIEIAQFSLGAVTGQASIRAVGVPLDNALPVDQLGVTVTVSEQNVRQLAGFLSGLELDTIELQDGIIRIGTELSLVFITLPVAVDLLPGAAEGGISFAPQTILLGEDQISVADLQANPLLASIAGTLLATQTFCVADQLPQALTIETVTVVGSDLVIDINGDGTALAGPSLSTVGTCPAA